jgi:hypothetical protein
MMKKEKFLMYSDISPSPIIFFPWTCTFTILSAQANICIQNQTLIVAEYSKDLKLGRDRHRGDFVLNEV